MPTNRLSRTSMDGSGRRVADLRAMSADQQRHLGRDSMRGDSLLYQAPPSSNQIQSKTPGMLRQDLAQRQRVVPWKAPSKTYAPAQPQAAVQRHDTNANERSFVSAPHQIKLAAAFVDYVSYALPYSDEILPAVMTAPRWGEVMVAFLKHHPDKVREFLQRQEEFEAKTNAEGEGTAAEPAAASPRKAPAKTKAVAFMDGRNWQVTFASRKVVTHRTLLCPMCHTSPTFNGPHSQAAHIRKHMGWKSGGNVSEWEHQVLWTVALHPMLKAGVVNYDFMTAHGHLNLDTFLQLAMNWAESQSEITSNVPASVNDDAEESTTRVSKKRLRRTRY
ncbi:hypothetical protein LTR53_004076 [Teratosphaeriaceae sp. CCFEE 6253]|nr:hypothetical protein LTR53_004076 [Teratosphaeriaceae sp. CCFEE 6253]